MHTFTESHSLLREAVRRFVESEVEPQAEHQDKIGELNLSLLKKCAELGLFGVTVSEEWGGSGMDTTAAVIIHHELSKSDPGFCLAYLAHELLFVNNFYFNANDDQRKRYLDKVLSGEWIGAMGMTEPGAGTDVLGMAATAVKNGDNYILNGRKIFITNGGEASIYIIYAKVDGRITNFVVERDTPGFSTSEKISKMGMRASTMCELIMDDCLVPAANLLGGEGSGLTSMMRNLEIERLALAAMSLGIADRCLEEMTRYAAERSAFGIKLHNFGQIQRYIAESYAKTEAARALIYNVAEGVSHGRRNRLGSDAAKLFAAPVAKEVADNAMQVLGGYGYCTEYKVERLLRDAKLLEIGGGTLESHQKNITKELTRG
ncbi:MAG TPA: isovaleryl-CoA dehydrogenase [Myxococcales bacterium]|nr:isovaleryl-CoA dehydrogenase [Myxococcales bacterium]HIN85259.1 isovaleryl-CoA dehydrogenase [Myxococcales bacterium]